MAPGSNFVVTAVAVAVNGHPAIIIVAVVIIAGFVVGRGERVDPAQFAFDPGGTAATLAAVVGFG